MKIIYIGSLSLFLATLAHAETKPPLRAEDGGLAHDVIDNAIRTKMPEISRCYADELERKPALGKGKVVTKFTIAPDGTVKTVSAVSNFSSQHLESCLERELKTLSFPRPVGGGTVEVSYPFHFAPSAASSAKRK